ncbi:hypothetical protein FS749_014629 [Ceratobasidium sp. UAMH 11750]|nr:hypothetical protein FS749_014629 [Ceratobasidium sp. UAMH 11750]
MLADYGYGHILIGEEIWPDVVGHVKTVEVTPENQTADTVHTPLSTFGFGMATTPQQPVNPFGFDTGTQAARSRAFDNPPHRANPPILSRLPSAHRPTRFSNLMISP